MASPASAPGSSSGAAGAANGPGFQPGSAAHFEALVESSEDAILSKDLDAVITSWNSAAQRLYGYTPSEAIGSHISMIIPEDRSDEEKTILAKVLAGERLQHYETERVTKDGRRLHVSLTVSPILSDGEIVGASVVARDVSERVRARRRAERLQEVTSALSREVEPDRAISVLLDSAVDALDADAAAIGMIDSSGEAVELVGSRGHSEANLADWQAFPLDADLPMTVAIRSGSPTWSGSAEDLAERFPLLSRAEIRYSALAVVPLMVEGRALGAVSFSFTDPRQFSAEDRAFATAIAQQAAHNVDRARVYDAERRTRQRLEFLARASEILNESLDVESTLSRLAQLSVLHVTDWCTIEMLAEDGSLRNMALEHVDRSKTEMVREYRRRFPPDPEAPAGSGKVIRTGRPELFSRLTDEVLVGAARGPEHLEALRSLELASAMTVPIVGREGAVGAITFASSDPDRPYDDDDLELAADLGRRAGQALETARAFQREHETALTLQRGLLPGRLPDVPGIRVAARYLPAEAGLEVGGDWYDVLRPDTGCVELVIGDVAGRGVRAASVMGRLAIAMRAYALEGRKVEDVISGVNRLMGEFESREIATVLQISLDPGTGRGSYVRAGHPPGLLRTPDGEVIELSGQGTPPLGWLDDLEPRVNAIETPPGSLLLLYTDGLIERRELDLDVGIERLKAALAEASDDPEAVVEQIPAALEAERVPDDIAVLAARFGS
jgi:PAS domain S-box-containing protein